MDVPYCNDPRCRRNRNGEKHKPHLTNEKQAGIYVGEIYCNDPRCRRNRNGEKHEAHIESIGFKPTIVQKLPYTTKGDTYSYCNDPRCRINRNGERHRPHSPDNPESYHIMYRGGHKAYPSPTATRMHFYEDRIVIDNPKLVIPYRSMKDIENIQEKRISALRVIVLGLIFLPLAIAGALWKKNHIYTVIRFRDEDDQMIVVDFEQNVDSGQSIIYKKMLDFHRQGNGIRI